MPGEDTDDTQSHDLPGAQLWKGLVRIGRSSEEDLNTRRHKKVLVHCPCSWLAAFHGAPWTLCCYVNGHCILIIVFQ